ncbi:MAG: FAD:protein FMN transferase [Acidobacteria bacterium]|nr:FAD:protein FMN transferase [Acidobacteriota bacterium]
MTTRIQQRNTQRNTSEQRRSARTGSLAATFSLLTLGAFCLSALPARSSGAALQLVRRAHYQMGTIFEISAYGKEEDTRRTAAAIEEAFAEIRQADQMMSDYRDDSDLTRLNQNGGTGFVPVPVELYDLLQESVKYSRLTGGAFDVTSGPLVTAWQRAAGQKRLLSGTELRRLLPLVGDSRLLFDDEQQAVQFDRPGVRVDLGAIAKGWAVDRAAAVLRRRGIERALISAGTSTLYAIGSPPSQQAWEIGIRHPRSAKVEDDANQDEETILATVALRDEALSTSASYEKYIEIQGKKYSHLLDPRSGIPAEGMLSATVIAPTAAESDALSTGVFILGTEQAAALLRRLELSGLKLSGIVAEAGIRDQKLVVRRIGAGRKTDVLLLQPVQENSP